MATEVIGGGFQVVRGLSLVGGVGMVLGLVGPVGFTWSFYLAVFHA